MSWLLFSIGAPLLMAIPLGWFGAGVTSQMSRGAALLVWASTSWLSWWVSDLSTRAIARLLGRRYPVSWRLLVAGFGVNLALARFYCPVMLDALMRIGLVQPTPVVIDYFTIERDLLDPHYVGNLLAMAIPGMLFWLAGNFAFERMNRQPRYPVAVPVDVAVTGGRSGHADSLEERSSVPPSVPDSPSGSFPSTALGEVASATPVIPRFFHRLSRLSGLHVRELVAVEAEDHYVQVHSTRGKELVYYRFRDALEELVDVPGLQIHRSTWVSRQHVVGLEGRGRDLRVVLATGDRLKVSLSNRGTILQAGLRVE